MRKKMLQIKAGLRSSVPSPAYLNYKKRIMPHTFYAWLCRIENIYLQHLPRYLASLGLPLENPEDIIFALEHPVYLEKLTDLEREARQFFIDDLGAYFEYTYDKLLTAEAWLQVEAHTQHGGQRTHSQA